MSFSDFSIRDPENKSESLSSFPVSERVCADWCYLFLKHLIEITSDFGFAWAFLFCDRIFDLQIHVL